MVVDTVGDIFENVGKYSLDDVLHDVATSGCSTKPVSSEIGNSSRSVFDNLRAQKPEEVIY